MTGNNTAPKAKTCYDRNFYAEHEDGSLRSARFVVPHVMKLVKPRSVVDVGCGNGTWLKAFEECGVEDISGLDGDYVQRDQLLIDPKFFHPMNLSSVLHFDREFSLAVSLEVAEHLPARSAPSFVKFLTELAPVVLFSAAVPHQGGENHINEQWPWYWEQLFEERGYRQIDVIRPHTWGIPDVEWWYQQNTFLYVSSDELRRNQELAVLERRMASHGHNRMHLVAEPILSICSQAASNPSLRQLVAQIPRAAMRAFKRQLWK